MDQTFIEGNLMHLSIYAIMEGRYTCNLLILYFFC